MTDKPIKIPGPDHPISVEANPSRVVVKVGGKIIADTHDALTLREAMGTMRPPAPAWRACLDRALAEDPARRWPSVEAFAEAMPKASYARAA